MAIEDDEYDVGNLARSQEHDDPSIGYGIARARWHPLVHAHVVTDDGPNYHR